MEELKLPPLTRDVETLEFTRDDKGTTLSFAASSEKPVERWFGEEVLSHDPKAIRLDRAKRGAMPLLFNHDWNDVIGMVDKARVENARLVVDAHLFDTARAKDVGAMLAGGLRNVSIGYRMHTVEEDKKSGVFTARDWEPFEVSIVTVPADPTVGIGRQLGGEELVVRMLKVSQPADTANHKGVQMDTTQQAAAAAIPAGEGAQVIDNAAPERLRIKTLQTLGRTHKIAQEDVDAWIDGGVSESEAAQKVLDVLAERAKRGVKDNPAMLGLSDKETKNYSLTRAIKACVEKSWPKVAPAEAEMSQQVAKQLGRSGSQGEHSFFVPLDVQYRAMAERQQRMAAFGQRDLVVGTSSAGGYLVGTDVMSFIEVLRNRSVVMRLGATTMPGLQGSVSVPKQLTSATAYWFATEAGTATESNITFGQLALSPKTVGGYVEISRQLLLQSTPNAEGIVNADLARVIALAVDAAALTGPGTAGQPTGISATSGVGTANPAAGTNIGYADMIKFQTTVAASNAMMPGFGYVTTPTIAGLLMGKPRFTNSDTPIWGGNILDGSLVGARAMTSLQVSSATMFGGDFSQVVIGEWGVLEIEANPYAQFQSGIVGVRALYSCDVGVRYGAAFAIGTGMTA